jgi:putative membrane protein
VDETVDDAQTGTVVPTHVAPTSWPERALNVLRGALIGVAEIVPGVSGGTIALIVGVYESLIRSAGHLVRAVVGGVARRPDARAHASQVRWGVVVPVLLGMFTAIVVGAAIIEPVLEEHPVEARAVFAGLILASLVVPARMVGGRWTAREVVVGLAAAALAFVLTGLPPAAEQDPPLLLVAFAASVAVCALVLPGVSGSFLLLTVGLYGATIGAVNDRDLVYLGTFLLGAVVGLGVFVTGLQWLLEHRHRITLVVMTGLMAGSLRALWPWQDEDRGLLPPGEQPGQVLALALAGAVVVVSLLLLEARARGTDVVPAKHVADVADPEV